GELVEAVVHVLLSSAVLQRSSSTAARLQARCGKSICHGSGAKLSRMCLKHIRQSCPNRVQKNRDSARGCRPHSRDVRDQMSTRHVRLTDALHYGSYGDRPHLSIPLKEKLN